LFKGNARVTCFAAGLHADNKGLNALVCISGSNSADRCTGCKKQVLQWYDSLIMSQKDKLPLSKIHELGKQLEKKITEGKYSKTKEAEIR